MVGFNYLAFVGPVFIHKIFGHKKLSNPKCSIGYKDSSLDIKRNFIPKECEKKNYIYFFKLNKLK